MDHEEGPEAGGRRPEYIYVQNVTHDSALIAWGGPRSGRAAATLWLGQRSEAQGALGARLEDIGEASPSHGRAELVVNRADTGRPVPGSPFATEVANWIEVPLPRDAQVAAGGALTGRAEIEVDAGAVVNSYIEVAIELEDGTHTIKIYTCVDYRHTTVTQSDTHIVVSQTSGTAAAYRYPVYAFANEGEDLVYSIQKQAR